jgi:hypothetical protein
MEGTAELQEEADRDGVRLVATPFETIVRVRHRGSR